MKKTVSLLLTLLLCLCALPAMAEDGLILTATVECRETVVLKAPASGELAPFSVRAGDVLAAEDTVFSVVPVKVYADIEGTVALVHAASGGSADAAVNRYGAVVQVEDQRRYLIEGNLRTGNNSAENRDLHVGTPVFLTSSGGSHTASGVVIAVNGTNFTVEVIGGDLVYTQEVKIYREEGKNNTLLARADLSFVQPRQYGASGTVVEMFVKPGDSVSPGDLLFTYVPDILPPGQSIAVPAGENLLVTGVSVQQGSSVSKGQALLTACRMGDYELVAKVEEQDLRRIALGDSFTVLFEESGLPSSTATVVSISPLGENDGEVSRYTVRLSFTAPEGAFPGMHATLER